MILLGNILATLVITIGVATGNVSSNNTKYGNALITDASETRHTKPVQQAQFNEDKNYTLANSYSEDRTTQSGYTITYDNYKYYLDGAVNTSSEYGNIYNTTYITESWVDSSKNNNSYTSTSSPLVAIYNITPYISSYGTNTQIYLDYKIQAPPNTTASFNYAWHVYQVENTYKQYIDLTIYNAQDLNQQLYTQASTTGTELLEDTGNFNMISNSTFGMNNTITIGNIEEEITIIVFITCYITSGALQDQIIKVTPNKVTLSGYHGEINYEVIDLPGLMFQILTMPFSFISTAFNLTVFPGTPYAFNFGNVFLTLIAAFILMWLIKKVLK